MTRPGRAFWIGLAIGGGVVAFGIAGFVRNRADTEPASSLRFLVGALVAHDVLWAWGVAAVSLIIVRLVPRRAQGIVAGALAVSAALTLVAMPALLGYGRLANNPSILPRDYTAGLLGALAVVWAVALVLLVLQEARRHAVDAAHHERNRPSDERDEGPGRAPVEPRRDPRRKRREERRDGW